MPRSICDTIGLALPTLADGCNPTGARRAAFPGRFHASCIGECDYANRPQPGYPNCRKKQQLSAVTQPLSPAVVSGDFVILFVKYQEILQLINILRCHNAYLF